MATPHRCPICGGRGMVSGGFYTTLSGHWTASNVSAETCRTCRGSGIVWEQGDIAAYPVPRYVVPETTG